MENSVKEVAVTGTSFTPEEVYEDGFFRFSYAHCHVIINAAIVLCVTEELLLVFKV